MDLAEAMLRPVDADELEHAFEDRVSPTTGTRRSTSADRAAAGDDWLLEQLFAGELAPRAGLAPASTRTQRAARRTEPTLPRLDRARRPGMVERSEQPCVSPLPSRTPSRGHRAV